MYRFCERVIDSASPITLEIFEILFVSVTGTFFYMIVQKGRFVCASLEIDVSRMIFDMKFFTIDFLALKGNHQPKDSFSVLEMKELVSK